MRFFEQKLSLGILIISIPLLFLPKFNLITIDSNETAGLRIDDFILFFIGTLFMWSHVLSHKRLYKIEGWLLLITLFSFISFFSNRFLVSIDLLHINAKIFYSVRLMEYFIFFYIGAMASHYFKVQTIIRAFFLWNFIIMALQKINLLGAITTDGYVQGASIRVYGVASFPSEMGLILNLLFCYMVWDNSISSRFIHLFNSSFIRHILRFFYLYWMFIIFGIFIIFTGNRISIIALLFCFFCRLISALRLRSLSSILSTIVIISLLLAGIGFLITHSKGIYERSASLLSVKNLELFYEVGSSIDITKEPKDIMTEGASLENYDISWWIRIHKWLFALKSFIVHPECYLQGLGPGFNQAALDGGLLRIVTEYGIIGTFLFWKFFACLYRLNLQTKWMIIAFLMNMVFFDAYLAYKTMSFLFFICGHVFENERHLSQKQDDELSQGTQLNSMAA